MTRRNELDTIVVELARFIANELDGRGELYPKLDLLVTSPDFDRGQVIAELWTLIQRLDPDPSPHICDYLSDVTLEFDPPSLAAMLNEVAE